MTNEYDHMMSKPPTYGIASTAARSTLAENLSALMLGNPAFGTLLALEKATENAGLKIGKSTIGRLCRGETPVNLDYIEVIALVFNLDPWQLLVPGLDPRSPPTLRSASVAEELLYKKIRELANEASKLEKP